MTADLKALLSAAGLDPSTLAPLFKSAEDGIYRATTSGDKAIENWRRLRAGVDASGYWPLILGGGISQIANDPSVVGDHPVAKILADADTIDAADFLRTRLAEQAEYGGPEHGDWPADAEPSNEFTIPYDIISKKPISRVHLALLPTTASWQATAYLRYGGWNDCPGPEQHVAVHRKWAQEYGAEIVGISDDVLEMSVGRPPRDRESALALATEQFAYCADIVDQGTETLEALAATLVDAPVWFFWWD